MIDQVNCAACGRPSPWAAAEASPPASPYPMTAGQHPTPAIASRDCPSSSVTADAERCSATMCRALGVTLRIGRRQKKHAIADRARASRAAAEEQRRGNQADLTLPASGKQGKHSAHRGQQAQRASRRGAVRHTGKFIELSGCPTKCASTPGARVERRFKRKQAQAFDPPPCLTVLMRPARQAHTVGLTR